MKVRYDRRADVLTVILKEGVAVSESDEGRPGIILDFDEAGMGDAAHDLGRVLSDLWVMEVAGRRGVRSPARSSKRDSARPARTWRRRPGGSHF